MATGVTESEPDAKMQRATGLQRRTTNLQRQQPPPRTLSVPATPSSPVDVARSTVMADEFCAGSPGIPWMRARS